MRAPALVVALALAVAIAAAGCARPDVAARPPATPLAAPDGVKRTSSVMTSGDAQLFEQCWRPGGAEPRGVLVVVHGIKDHSSRYHDLAVALVAAGYAVCGFDHRGHGRSSGPRFAIHSFAAVMDDIDRYIAAVRKRFTGVPVALFGHSMGAAMVPLYVIERRPDLAGVVLSATALRPRIHPFEIASLRLTAALFPNAALLDTPDEDFSPDPAVIRAMRDDPLIPHGKGTGRMGVELVAATERVWKRAGEIELPILLLHGTADRTTDPRGSVELHQRVASTDKKLVLIDGAGHDLAHDPKRAEATRAIIEFLSRVMPPG